MGNSNSSKSSPKKACSFCRKESCQGKSCKYFYSGEAVSSSSSAGFNRSYPSAAPAVARSTSGTQHVTVGNVSVAPGALKPASTIQQSNAYGTTSKAVYPGQLSADTVTKSQSGSTVQQRNAGVTSSRTIYGDAFPTSTSATHLVKQTSVSKITSQGGNSAYLAVQSQPPLYFSNVEQDNEVATNLTAKNLDQLSISKQWEGAGRNIHGNVEKRSTESEERVSSIAKSGFSQVGKPIRELNSFDVKIPLVRGSFASVLPKNSGNAEVTGGTTERKPIIKHSPHAVKYEGVILQIIGSRNAKVRVYERNGVPVQKSEWEADDIVHKHALLVVDKLINDESGSFYPPKTVMRDVICRGDIVGMICTFHNNQSTGFQLYAHEAWLTGERTQINDTESVASFISKSGSDTQESTSSKTKKDSIALRNTTSVNITDGNSSDAADVVNQWLDSNKYCLNKNDSSKPLRLIGGCHYIGKVVEIRSSYGFIVEISSKEGRQFVFVLPNLFYPQGISGPALFLGTSLESCVNVGDEIVVIPVRNVAEQEGKFEWVASKAWPKNIQLVSSTAVNNKKLIEPTINPKEEQSQLKDMVAEKTNLLEKHTVAYIKSLYPTAKNWKEFDGEIISLQYNWGLVKDKVNSQVAYAFTRENTYLFGLGLEHFILDDVFKMGQSVKFSVDVDEAGAMYALAVWSGNKLPDYHTFDLATGNYCEENGINFATEESLIQHGKALYLGR